MKWNNLLYDSCPKCNNKLYVKDEGVTCSGKNCDFFITHNKLIDLKDKLERESRSKSKEFEGFGFED